MNSLSLISASSEHPLTLHQTSSVNYLIKAFAMAASHFDVASFTARLRSLQWFCNETDRSSPRALLFIPGPDGRNNPGSVNILKFLFRGSTGKSLFDETLDDTFEVLEDIVLMIKETSISVIYR